MSIVEEAMLRLNAAQKHNAQLTSEMPALPRPAKPVWHKLLVAGGAGFVLGMGAASALLYPVGGASISAMQAQEAAKSVQSLDVASNPNSENNRQRQVALFIDGWIKAWSEKDLDNYLSAYAPEFEPPGGLTRSDWEKQRRKRLAKYHKIEIKLSRLTAISKGDAATVEFIQSFKADEFSETDLHKRLELRLHGDRWMIMKEISRKG